MSPRVFCLALFFATMIAASASAQVDVGVTPSVLLSYQPIDDAYVGSPYLSEGIGGVGPGFGVGVNVIVSNGFVFGAEYSTARFEKEQYGRLVRGGFPFDGIPATTRFHDSTLSVLAGYATAGRTRAVFVAGVSAKLDRTTIDGVDRGKYDTEETQLVGLTGGIDLLHPLSSRVQLAINARYTFNERHLTLQYLGIGPHVVRAGAGVRIRLN